MNQINPRDIKRPDGSIRINRPGGWEEEGPDAQNQAEPVSPVSVRGRRSNRGVWILLAAVVVVIAVFGLIYKDRLLSFSKNPTGVSEFQAVFLTNGQVYFGKLSDAGDRYVELENIYYLQVTPVLQTKTEGQPGSAPTQEQQQQLSLVKLGNELHAPADRMKINRDQILFFEDLKSDGKVVQAIKKYEEDQSKK